MIKPAPVFEHTTCSRCCGTGTYSFNLIHGTKCYGCNGAGYKLTKRGAAASSYLKAIRSRPASEIKEGDVILFDMHFFRVFTPVTSVEVNENGSVTIRGIRHKTGENIGFTVWPDDPVRLSFSADQKQAQIEQALAYQSSLKKDGTPYKRPA